MTQGIQYRPSSSGIAPAPRGVGAVTASPRARPPHRTLVQAWAAVRQQRWFRFLAEVPDALVDDVAPGPLTVGRNLRAELNRLDARLGVRFY